MKTSNLILAGLLSFGLLAPGISQSIAKPFVWARAGDALSLDPHAVNEGSTHALNHQIYEPLIIRNHAGKLEPARQPTPREPGAQRQGRLARDVEGHGRIRLVEERE